jgi:hypothetical protein
MNIDATHLMQHVFPSELAWQQRKKHLHYYDIWEII